MLLADAYRAFDCNRDGVLSPEEFYGGITWIGIDLTPSQVKEIADEMDRDQDGCISFADFSRVLSDPEKQIARRSIAWPSPIDDESVEGKTPAEESMKLRHLETEQDWSGITPRSLRPEEALRSLESHTNLFDRVRSAAAVLKVSVRNVGGLVRIWDSESLGVRMMCTVWCPKLPTPSSHRVHVSLGHYASAGVGRISDDVSRLYLTLTDTTSWRVFKSQHLDQEIIDILLPHPIRYVEVWRHKAGDRQLFVWRPIPPSSGFVSLGMLATPSDDPPDVTECRCVPRSWTVSSTFRPIQIWKDAGGGGRPGSFWVLNSLGLLQGTEQHSLPKGEYYDLHSPEFMANFRIDEVDLNWKISESGSAASPARLLIAPPPRRKAPRHDNHGPTLEDREKGEYLKQKSLLFGLQTGSVIVTPQRTQHSETPISKFYVCDLFPGKSVDVPRMLEDALYRSSQFS